MSPGTPAEIADRDARRLARVLEEIGGEGAPIAGGWMACDLPGSWADHAAGLGVHGPVDSDALDRLVAFYVARGRTPRIQVTPYQHLSLLTGLAERGFAPYEQETVLVRRLADLAAIEPVPDLAFRAVDPEDDASVAAFRHSQVAGFFGDEPPPPGMLPITDRVARASRCQLWLLELDGRVVGSGGLETFENSAVLIAGCVHPDARRKGLQTAFIRYRLHQAATQGLEYVTIASTPGGPTERNSLRAGFRAVYTQIGLQLRQGSKDAC